MTALDIRAGMTTGGIVAGKEVGPPGRGIQGSALDALSRPIPILVGPFGCGKTEIAVNLFFADLPIGVPEARVGGRNGAGRETRAILAMERHIVAPFAPKPHGARRRSAVV